MTLPGIQIVRGNNSVIVPKKPETSVSELITIMAKNMIPWGRKTRYDIFRNYKAVLENHLNHMLRTTWHEGYFDKYKLNIKMIEGNRVYVQVHMYHVGTGGMIGSSIGMEVRLYNYRLDGFDRIRKVLKKR